MLLVCVSRKDYKRKDVSERTKIMNDVVVIFIFGITFVNIFIATFGIDDERTTYQRWKEASATDASALASATEPFLTPIGATTSG